MTTTSCSAASAPARRSGILCHPTCMPGNHGIGDLGDGAYHFIDFLADAGQSLWQVLPLGPTGYGDSPYQPFSAFAGNHLLISLDRLVDEGLLTSESIGPTEGFSADAVSYGDVIKFKDSALRQAYAGLSSASQGLCAEYQAYSEANRPWLNDYSLFMALKIHFRWAPWVEWEQGIALSDRGALDHYRSLLEDEVGYQRFIQFLFDRQWGRVRRYANDRGISIVGDVPIFVGHDSVDVWSNRELFLLDKDGRPSAVAGVPPDYFSPTGQLWGNPLYRWDRMRGDGYAWWVARLRRVLTQFDVVRLDHFRGFSGFWEVPAGEETAIHGRWVNGPGEGFFHAMERQIGRPPSPSGASGMHPTDRLPIIAEDLGLITPDVHALRKSFGLPGMKVLQFAFGSDGENEHLPHNYASDCVAYSGTHDNDTSAGWYATSDERTRHRARTYTGTDGRDMSWALVRLAMTSVAAMAIFPLQDVLGLGTEARLNLPGRPHGNWTWRYRQDALRPELADALRQLAIVSGRCPDRDWEQSRMEIDEGTVTSYEDP